MVIENPLKIAYLATEACTDRRDSRVENLSVTVKETQTTKGTEGQVGKPGSVQRDHFSHRAMEDLTQGVNRVRL